MLNAQDLVEKAKKSINEISVDEAKIQLAKKANIQVIDVREADEYAQGHIDNAINIPRGVLEFKIDETVADKQTPIIVYCKTGGRAALSTQTLAQLGYSDVKSIAGGYESWVAVD